MQRSLTSIISGYADFGKFGNLRYDGTLHGNTSFSSESRHIEIHIENL